MRFMEWTLLIRIDELQYIWSACWPYPESPRWNNLISVNLWLCDKRIRRCIEPDKYLFDHWFIIYQKSAASCIGSVTSCYRPLMNAEAAYHPNQKHGRICLGSIEVDSYTSFCSARCQQAGLSQIGWLGVSAAAVDLALISKAFDP